MSYHAHIIYHNRIKGASRTVTIETVRASGSLAILVCVLQARHDYRQHMTCDSLVVVFRVRPLSREDRVRRIHVDFLFFIFPANASG